MLDNLSLYGITFLFFGSIFFGTWLILKTRMILIIFATMYIALIKVPYIIMCFIFNKQILIYKNGNNLNGFIDIALRSRIMKFKFNKEFRLIDGGIYLETGSRAYNNICCFHLLKIKSLIPFKFRCVNDEYFYRIEAFFKENDILKFKKGKEEFIVKFIEHLQQEKCILVEVLDTKIIENYCTKHKLNIPYFTENGCTKMYVSFNDYTYYTKYQFLDNYTYVGRQKLKLKDFLSEC